MAPRKPIKPRGPISEDTYDSSPANSESAAFGGDSGTEAPIKGKGRTVGTGESGEAKSRSDAANKKELAKSGAKDGGKARLRGIQ